MADSQQEITATTCLRNPANTERRASGWKGAFGGNMPRISREILLVKSLRCILKPFSYMKWLLKNCKGKMTANYAMEVIFHSKWDHITCVEIILFITMLSAYFETPLYLRQWLPEVSTIFSDVFSDGSRFLQKVVLESNLGRSTQKWSLFSISRWP